jgi:hypothetical protein
MIGHLLMQSRTLRFSVLIGRDPPFPHVFRSTLRKAIQRWVLFHLLGHGAARASLPVSSPFCRLANSEAA